MPKIYVLSARKQHPPYLVDFEGDSEMIQELTDSQFLKIRVQNGWIFFEVFEQPPEKWKRPYRHHIYKPISNLVNRHKRKSKLEFIEREVATVIWQFKKFFEQD